MASAAKRRRDRLARRRRSVQARCFREGREERRRWQGLRNIVPPDRVPADLKDVTPVRSELWLRSPGAEEAPAWQS
jgi:hypothetical protein